MSNNLSGDQYPLVTVITPSFNQGKYIEETIQSVLKQDYPNLEYLVFDGASNDNTLEILQQYKNKLAYVSEQDRGQANAINKGLRRAKGQIISWLNSDDTYEPGAIKAAVKYFQVHPEVKMIYGKGAHVHENGQFMEWYPTEPFDYKRLAETCYICQPAVFLRSEVIEKIGLLDENLSYCMDYEFWIRIAKQLKIDYVPIHLANTRVYGDTKTFSMRVPVHSEIIKVVKKYYGVAPTRWIFAYCHYVLDRFLKRRTKLKDFIYVSLLVILLSINGVRFNRSLRTPGMKEQIAGCINHLKTIVFS